MKRILKIFQKKREAQKVTLESVSEGVFPVISEDLVSLVEYLEAQARSERWFLELSESGRYGSLCSFYYIVNKLNTIKEINNNKFKDMREV